MADIQMNQIVQQQIAGVSLIVEKYDEAIAFYTETLQFNLLEDTDLGDGKRWVLISPPNSNGANLFLIEAKTQAQRQIIGNQAGDGVFMILQTNDFWRDYELMKSNGVAFLEEPRVEEYGTVVIFEDLYGNKWDLLQSI